MSRGLVNGIGGTAMEMAATDPTPAWKRRLRERVRHLLFMAKVNTYHRFIYRHHMRLIHPKRHGWKRLHPMGGPPMDRCDWCGLTRTYSNLPTFRVDIIRTPSSIG